MQEKYGFNNPKVVHSNDVKNKGNVGYNIEEAKSLIMEKPVLLKKDFDEETLKGDEDPHPQFNIKNRASEIGNTSQGYDSIKSIYNLSVLFLKHPDQSQGEKLNECLNSSNLCELNKLIKLKCKKCGNLKFTFKRNCSHDSCFYCLQNQIKMYVNNPELNEFKALRCKKCFEIPHLSDLEKLFKKPGDTISKYKKALLIKPCSWCKRKLNVATDYLPELNCLHLCRDCYVDQIFMNIKSCMVCNKNFSNKEITLRRKIKCTKCNLENNLVLECFKCFHEDKILCFDCQSIIAKDKNWKLAFGNNDHPQKFRHFKFYFQKTCPSCNLDKSVSEINRCLNCGNIKCIYCCDLRPQCELCGNQVN